MVSLDEEACARLFVAGAFVLSLLPFFLWGDLMPSKAAYILELGDDGQRSTREIAEIVYGEATDAKMAYVRVVLRQRKGGRSSKHDNRYRASPLCKRTRNKRWSERYYTDPNFRLDCLLRRKQWGKVNPEKEKAYRRTYWRRRYYGDPIWREKELVRKRVPR